MSFSEYTFSRGNPFATTSSSSSTFSTSTISSSSTSITTSTSSSTAAAAAESTSSVRNAATGSRTPQPSATGTEAAAFTQSPFLEQRKGGLSTGAQAGIGVGVGVVGLALIVLGAFLLLRRRRRSRNQAATVKALPPSYSSGSSEEAMAQINKEVVSAVAVSREEEARPRELHDRPMPAELPSEPKRPRPHSDADTMNSIPGLASTLREIRENNDATPRSSAAREATPGERRASDEGGAKANITSPTATFDDDAIALAHLEAEKDRVRQERQRMLREDLQELEKREVELERQITKRRQSWK